MKGKIRRPRFVLALTVALMAAGLAALLFFGQSPPPTPVPNPNGYDDLLKAGQAITATVDDANDLDHDRLHALVATNAEALRLLRVGLARQCAVPTDVQITNFATVTRDLINLKSLALLLLAEGRLAELENRPADAARSYVDSICLGAAVSHGGLAINRLLGIACEGMGIIPLVKLLPKLTCEQMRPTIEKLEQIENSSVSWREIRQNQSRVLRSWIERLLAFWWQPRKLWNAAEGRHDLAAARRRLLLVELALRCHRCDHGNAPEMLQQLVPAYLQELPSDPFGNLPLVYRPTGSNWFLYSLGPDRKDNGGKSTDKRAIDPLGFGGESDKNQPESDVLYDSPW